MANRDAELSAPEASILLSLPRYDAAKVLKTGFIGLLAQGVLRLETEDRPGLIRTRHIPHLKVAETRRRPCRRSPPRWFRWCATPRRTA